MKFDGNFLAFFVLHSSVCSAFVQQGRPLVPRVALNLQNGREMMDLEGRLASRLSALDRSQTMAPNVGIAPTQGLDPSQGMDPDIAAFSRGSEPQKVWDTTNPMVVQGGSLRTWSFSSPRTERVQVHLKTDGRPLDADIELWSGPDNTPHKMKVYIEDGSLRPFNAVVDTPRGPNTVAIRNTGHLEFPMTAFVGPDFDESGLLAHTLSIPGVTIQGGALRTFPFDHTVESVKIQLQTDGRPLNARIELLQGPNNNKQVIELYTEDGLERPFFSVLDTPGSGNVVKVSNTAPIEFPLTAVVEPFQFGNGDTGYEQDGIMMGRQW